MNWCILIPLLVGLISALLGYLLGKLLSGGGENHDSASINMWRDKNAQLEADLEACRTKLAAKPVATTSVASGFTAATAAAITFNGAAAKTAFGKAIKQDDLTVIEGIGPKIRDLFHDHGVATWHALSETSIERCQEILNSGGERYSVHNPGTWPRQAAMAYQGDWVQLKEWQDILDHGKE